MKSTLVQLKSTDVLLKNTGEKLLNIKNMGRKTFVEKLAETKLLISGLKGRKNNLPTGISEQQLTETEAQHQKVETLNQEQEKLKADLKVKTAELNAEMKKLEGQTATIRKYTKLGTKPEEWREFGIEDKR